MNILITGVAGLLGSNLADWITDNHPGHAIIGIDDLSGGYLDNINSSVIFYKEDLINDNLNYIFKNHKIDLIFHFAAYAAEGLSPFMRSYNYKNNLISTTKLINMAIEYDIKRFVFTSSMATYGRGKAPFDEKDIPMPIDPYGIAKYACEMDLRVAREQHGLDYCIVRPHNVYGKKQNKDIRKYKSNYQISKLPNKKTPMR
jgi:UDP-glucose 4-epimerase